MDDRGRDGVTNFILIKEQETRLNLHEHDDDVDDDDDDDDDGEVFQFQYNTRILGNVQIHTAMKCVD